MIKKLQKLYERMIGRQRIIELHKDIVAIHQQVAGVQDLVSTTQNDIVAIHRQVAELQDLVTTTQNDSAGVRQQIKALQKALLALRYHAHSFPDESLPPVAKLDQVIPISEQFNRLNVVAPQAYSVWRALLGVNEEAYEELPIDSCSVPGHPMAIMFRFFLSSYLRGRVLDIGCGPQPVPIYLEDFPLGALYGIDPLSEQRGHPFHFLKGLAEFLPWADSQFNTVVAATSLDHVLLLDKVFAEVQRVLRPEGFFVVWVSFIRGSKPYDPYQKTIEKVDKYHLFHFDREWFLNEIDPFFTIFEEFVFDPPEISSFFSLQPRKHV